MLRLLALLPLLGLAAGCSCGGGDDDHGADGDADADGDSDGDGDGDSDGDGGVDGLDPNTCAAAAEAQLEVWRGEGRADEEIERLFQLSIAECLDRGADPGTPCIHAAANLDYTRFARRFVVRELDVRTYLALVRDRSRKVRLARSDAAFREGCPDGDADGDLVPDAVDACEGTLPDTTTDDRGCDEDPEMPVTPDDEDVREILDHMGLIAHPACAEAPAPSSPAPLKFGHDNDDRSDVAFAVTRVTNQPAGCPVMYEVRVRMVANTGSIVASPVYYSMVFRDFENTDLVSPLRRVFRVNESSTGDRLGVFQQWRYYQYAEWRVRAVNGNGSASSWSARLQTEPSFGEP